MGKFKLSVPLYEDVLKRQRAVLGPDHPTTLVTMANVGVNHRDAGDLQKGIEYLEQAWALARKRPGTLGEQLGSIRAALAETYDRAGEFTRAEPLAREALDNALKQYGADSPQTAIALDWLGRILLRQHKDGEAESLLRQSLDLREEHDAEAWETSNTRSMLGGSLLGRKKHAEAESLLLSGYEGLKRHEETIPLGGKDFMTEAIERLVRLYEAMDKKDEAEAWRAKLPAPVATGSATKRNE